MTSQRDWGKVVIEKPRPPYVEKDDRLFAVPRPDRSHHRAAADFPVGTRVRVVCKMQDWAFFRGTETGEVIRNGNRYLSIIVRFDEPMHYEDGHIRTEHGFEPSDLVIEGEVHRE